MTQHTLFLNHSNLHVARPFLCQRLLSFLRLTFFFFLQVVILCTTFAIFGTCMWFFMQSASRISPVYVPTIIFAGMSSVITMVTPTLQHSITENSKVREPIRKGTLVHLARKDAVLKLFGKVIETGGRTPFKSTIKQRLLVCLENRLESLCFKHSTEFRFVSRLISYLKPIR